MMQHDLFRYPIQPGTKSDDDTTHEAARHTDAPTLRAAVQVALRTHGPATADQVARCLNESPLSIRPRFSELRAMELIFDTGDRAINASGRQAIIWGIRG
jgi:hypothetical protein